MGGHKGTTLAKLETMFEVAYVVHSSLNPEWAMCGSSSPKRCKQPTEKWYFTASFNVLVYINVNRTLHQKKHHCYVPSTTRPEYSPVLWLLYILVLAVLGQNLNNMQPVVRRKLDATFSSQQILYYTTTTTTVELSPVGQAFK